MEEMQERYERAFLSRATRDQPQPACRDEATRYGEDGDGMQSECVDNALSSPSPAVRLVTGHNPQLQKRSS